METGPRKRKSIAMVKATEGREKARESKSVMFRVPRLQDRYRVPARMQGTKSKLGITQFIVAVLAANETNPKVRKLTDESIKAMVVAEFPHAKSVKRLKEGKITIGYWRTLYNIGHFTNGERPSPQSQRYTVKGEVANLRTGRPALGSR